MEWLVLLAIAFIAIGIVGTLLPMLPGTPLVFAGMLLIAWLDQFTKVSILTISIVGIIALASWAIDFGASLFTAKKAGASKQALWGTTIGALLGIAGGIPGLIIGPALGAIVGELIAHRNTARATTVGVAAGMGFILALVAKVLLLIAMLSIFGYAYYL